MTPDRRERLAAEAGEWGVVATLSRQLETMRQDRIGVGPGSSTETPRRRAAPVVANSGTGSTSK